MIQGIVLWYNRAKSWGFLAPSPGQPSSDIDVFVHRTAIIDQRKFLVGGERCEFEIVERSGKPCAANVHVLTAAALATGGANAKKA
jgi:cold shock CspA family protein